VKPWPADKALPRWGVRTAHLVAGRWIHFFATRAARRKFHQKHGGERFDVIRSRHG